MATQFYPDTKRLFEEITTGRKLSYTPLQVIEEFKLYIEDLRSNPVEVETEYRQHTQTNADERNQRTAQTRKQKFNRPPKVYDFVTRWLGKSDSWWRLLDKGKRGKQFLTVKNKITQYCYDCKFDGAVIGVYKENIIARDLGLKDKYEYEQHNRYDDMTLDEINKEIERLTQLEQEASD